MIDIKLERRDLLIVFAGAVICTALITMLVVALDYDHFMQLRGEAASTAILHDFLFPMFIGFPCFSVVFWKIRQLSQAKKKLEILASTDGLTGCMNRRAFTEKVLAKLDKAKTVKNTCAMMIIDLDHFKQINDELGHIDGDRALVAVTGPIVCALGPGELFGRMGGEEFAVFLPRANEASARLAAERIRLSVLASGFSVDEKAHELSASVGVAVGQTGSSFDQLYRQADQCLYRAKKAGRNRVVLSNMHSVADQPARKAKGA